MDPIAFELLMDRFDRVDADNKAIQKSIEEHIDADDLIHKIVDKHSTYWTLALAIGAALLATAGSVAVAFVR